ncbi:MAG TPA: DNA-3-methyladenine glycosylase I [Actinospica sp.]|jgi:DNA-3-methyladenine glycosylase I|nr:DNA-3-methyladenine glycosylase I [Actinospica sp.]
MDDHGVTIGADGLARCPWAGSDPLYLGYHDAEWGRPLRGENELYERVCLEAFQSGLAWITILRKRENFRAAFAGFEIAKVAEFGEADVARLLADEGIVRNKAKVHAAIANAKAALALDGGLTELIWSHAPAKQPRPRSTKEIPATTAESVALAKTLKKSGFAFVGPTTAYALMQACGLVNDHLVDCHAR